MSNLTLTDTTIKLGELNIDKTQFDLPKHLVIISARVRDKYREVNGEQVRTDGPDKLICSVQDDNTIKALKDLTAFY